MYKMGKFNLRSELSLQPHPMNMTEHKVKKSAIYD